MQLLRSMKVLERSGSTSLLRLIQVSADDRWHTRLTHIKTIGAIVAISMCKLPSLVTPYMRELKHTYSPQNTRYSLPSRVRILRIRNSAHQDVEA
jgi:hypothetical protein